MTDKEKIKATMEDILQRKLFNLFGDPKKYYHEEMASKPNNNKKIEEMTPEELRAFLGEVYNRIRIRQSKIFQIGLQAFANLIGWEIPDYIIGGQLVIDSEELTINVLHCTITDNKTLEDFKKDLPDLEKHKFVIPNNMEKTLIKNSNLVRYTKGGIDGYFLEKYARLNY